MMSCFNEIVEDKIKELGNNSLLRIKELFIRGKEDLQKYYDEELFPKYIKSKVDEQKTACEKHGNPDDETPYSDVFLEKLEEKG